MEKAVAGVEYVGIAGATKPCVEAVARLLMTQPLERAVLLTSGVETNATGRQASHAFMLLTDIGDPVFVKSGFSSGYGGAGPGGLGRALRLLESFDVAVTEVSVSAGVLNSINMSSLPLHEVERIMGATGSSRDIYGYAHGRFARPIKQGDWSQVLDCMPMQLIDPRLSDLAAGFGGKRVHHLREAFVRLEDTLRQRTGLDGSAAELCAIAFSVRNGRLGWPELPEKERAARVALFEAVFRAHRNPRAHRTVRQSQDDDLSEFLVVNHLFRLESQAVALFDHLSEPEQT